MTTFSAAHKLSRRFISTPSLHLPNINLIVATFLAFHTNRGHRLDLLLFLTYDRHKRFRLRLNNLNHFGLISGAGSLLNITTLCTNENRRPIRFFRLKPTPTFRAKFHKLQKPSFFPNDKSTMDIRFFFIQQKSRPQIVEQLK